MSSNKFNLDTKRILAQRAGYMCSICGKLTVGASSETKRSVSLHGDAAHIESAEPLGKRYNKSMSSNARQSIENGIWLCKDHHKIVDSDECEYTVPYLYTIKENHEKRITILNTGINLNNGLVVNLNIKNFSCFKGEVSIDFGNSTLFFGGNGTGKTLIVDILTSLGNIEKINKWKSRRNQGSSAFKLEYYDTCVKSYGVNYSSKNAISFSFNDSIVPSFLSPYHCLSFEENFYDETEEIDELIDKLAYYFHIDKDQLIDLVNYINKVDKRFINEMYFEEDNLKVMMSNKSPLLSFYSLSKGEQYRVLLELGLRLADFYSKYKPVLFIVEHSAIGSLDTAGVNRLLKSIENRKTNYQFIFTSYMEMEKFEFIGHTAYKLMKKGDENTEITLANNVYTK